MLTGRLWGGMGWVGQVIEWRTRCLLLRLSPMPQRLNACGFRRDVSLRFAVHRLWQRFRRPASNVSKPSPLPVDLPLPALRLYRGLAEMLASSFYKRPQACRGVTEIGRCSRVSNFGRKERAS